MGTRDLVGVLVTLRSLQRSFLIPYCAMFSRTVRAVLRVNSLYSEAKYFLECVKQADKHFIYGIFDNVSGLLVGVVMIRNKEQYGGQLYGWLNEHFWGKGLYQQAIMLIAQNYFELTQELFFTAHVDYGNKRGYYALKKSGFADAGLIQGPYGLQYKLLLRKNIGRNNTTN